MLIASMICIHYADAVLWRPNYYGYAADGAQQAVHDQFVSIGNKYQSNNNLSSNQKDILKAYKAAVNDWQSSSFNYENSIEMLEGIYVSEVTDKTLKSLTKKLKMYAASHKFSAAEMSK